MWPEFTIPELRYKEINVNMDIRRALKSDQCRLWNTYLVQLQTMLGKVVYTKLSTQKNVWYDTPF